MAHEINYTDQQQYWNVGQTRMNNSDSSFFRFWFPITARLSVSSAYKKSPAIRVVDTNSPLSRAGINAHRPHTFSEFFLSTLPDQPPG
jgi:hypothetical protein